jgi:hypothetical protein
MAWTSTQFWQQLNPCASRYERENAWFKKSAWGDEINYGLAAWRLYRCASTSSLGMLLLGSAKIRKDETLLLNFGATSGSGASDAEEQRLVAELERARSAMRSAPGLQDAPKVLGHGSILSDQKWTPLMNDCFILGGVHAAFEFHLAEDGAAAFFARNPPTPATIAAPGGHAAAAWEQFFKANPQLLCNQGLPRVLARELVGLSTFGYRPRFLNQQLSFYCAHPGQAKGATFSAYLDAIQAAGFAGNHVQRVLDTVSTFLFGRKDVLRAT